MTDVTSRMIELIDAVKTDEHYFSIIGLNFNDTRYKLKFGILQEDYNRLRYILTYRPFENTGVGKYRYFFAMSYQKDRNNKGVSLAGIRIEQLKQDKKFDFALGNQYIANLLWFREIKEKRLFDPFFY